MRSYRRTRRYPARRSRRLPNLVALPAPPPDYRADVIGKHSEIVEIRIGGDVFRLNLSGVIEQLTRTARRPRPKSADILPFPDNPS